MDDVPGSAPRVTPRTWQRVAWALTMIALVVSAVLLSGSSWEILAYTAAIVSFVVVAWFARSRAAGPARRDARRDAPR